MVISIEFKEKASTSDETWDHLELRIVSFNTTIAGLSNLLTMAWAIPISHGHANLIENEVYFINDNEAWICICVAIEANAHINSGTI